MRQTLSITRKELEGYFDSPLAIIFLGAFLAVELFIFFTAERFFARGIADVRPLFRWMPVLLIFLVAALTMRQWSEEQRSGTLEVMLTLPVRHVQLVLGKFLAVMAIVGLALLLTTPLPISVSMLGNLDWGPVIGGYFAGLLMAAAYAAIGLFLSSRTDNQIVALLSTALLGGVFYLLGTRGVTDFVGGPASEILWALGTGSRFESIERGVIDLRDLVYYLSLTAIFLLLNTLSLDAMRWSQSQDAYRRRVSITAGLLLANLLLVNVWLFPLHGLRLDLTAGREFTISETTRNLLDNLQEPLLMRAYISEQNHPLLSPLVPRIRDMLREYEIAAGGMLTAEVVDPIEDPDIEAEAYQTYGIRPSPFQISGRHEASVINAYFDILIRYGDQTEILNFSDLIEVEPRPDGVDVRLRNLEYDLTRAVKRVVFGFQSVDAILSTLEQPVQLTYFVSPASLPQDLAATDAVVRQVGQELQREAGGQLVFQVVDPRAADRGIDPGRLQEEMGIQPIPVSFFSQDSFYFHLLLQNQDENQVLFPTGDMAAPEVRSMVESALKRTSPGFLRTVGLWTPPETPTQDMFGQQQQPLSTYSFLRDQLGQEYEVQSVDLSTGRVPETVDVLVVVAPQNIGDMEVFAIDQFLMRGGAVVLAVSAHKPISDPMTGSLAMQPIENPVIPMLESYGVRASPSFVMDTQNDAFPITVTRDAGGLQLQEIQALDYPFFVDVRPDAMSDDSLIVSGLPAVTLNWASPVELHEAAEEDLVAEVLLRSSPNAWLYEGRNIIPDFELYPETGFQTEAERDQYPLAVSLRGVFESYFADRANPFEGEEGSEAGEGPEAQPTPTLPAEQEPTSISTIEQSPLGARLVVFGSSTFVDDFVLQLSARLSRDRYLNNLLLMQNAVDWSVEDPDLLQIRARGSNVRVLAPLTENQQTLWEVGNYVLALLGLLAVYFLWRERKRRQVPIELIPMDELSKTMDTSGRPA
jgi:ABC-2 type transport system permease protein